MARSKSGRSLGTQKQTSIRKIIYKAPISSSRSPLPPPLPPPLPALLLIPLDGIVSHLLQVSKDGDVLRCRAKVFPPTCHIPIHFRTYAMRAAYRHQSIGQPCLQREFFETACSVCSVRDAMQSQRVLMQLERRSKLPVEQFQIPHSLHCREFLDDLPSRLA